MFQSGQELSDFDLKSMEVGVSAAREDGNPRSGLNECQQLGVLLYFVCFEYQLQDAKFDGVSLGRRRCGRKPEGEAVYAGCLTLSCLGNYVWLNYSKEVAFVSPLQLTLNPPRAKPKPILNPSYSVVAT